MNEVCVEKNNGVVFVCTDIGKAVITRNGWTNSPEIEGLEGTFILKNFIKGKGREDNYTIRDLYNIIEK